MGEYEDRARARENTAKALLDHERKQGKDPSWESCKKHVDQRADMIDNKKDSKK